MKKHTQRLEFTFPVASTTFQALRAAADWESKRAQTFGYHSTRLWFTNLARGEGDSRAV